VRLSFKIAIYMVGIIASAVILLTYLTNAKFRSLQEEVERSRFLVLALDVKATAERGLALGLALEQMNNLAEILERLHEEHPEILSLQIVSDRGDSLHHVGETRAHTGLDSALDRLRLIGVRDSQPPVDISDGATFGMMLPLVNAFDQMAGVLVLRYDRAPSLAAARDVTFDQLKIAGLALLLTAVIALILTSLYLHRLSRGFARMARLLEQPDERPGQHKPADVLEGRFSKFRAQVHALEAKVAKVDAALLQADRNGHERPPPTISR